jgi:hypothetical protein
MKREELKLELKNLADRFSEGWHEGIKIDASDIMLLNEAAQALAQRTWVGLTDDEVEKLDCVQVIWQDEGEVEICGVKEFYRNIEAKLKENNGYAEEKNT